jgi:hypothetical protein
VVKRELVARSGHDRLVSARRGDRASPRLRQTCKTGERQDVAPAPRAARRRETDERNDDAEATSPTAGREREDDPAEFDALASKPPPDHGVEDDTTGCIDRVTDRPPGRDR